MSPELVGAIRDWGCSHPEETAELLRMFISLKTIINNFKPALTSIKRGWYAEIQARSIEQGINEMLALLKKQHPTDWVQLE